VFSVPLAAWFCSRRESVAALILFCLAPSFTSGFTEAPAQDANPAQQRKAEGRLEVGKPVEKTLAGGETHSYQMPVDAGQFLHAVVSIESISERNSFHSDGGEPLDLD
jgi:hypothetical protein